MYVTIFSLLLFLRLSLCTLKKKTSKNILFRRTAKKINYLAIYLTEEEKDLYNENIKTLKKEIIEYTRWQKDLFVILDWQN